MKRLSIILGILFLCTTSVLADETMANQDIKLESNKAVIKVQKQPANALSQQKASVKNNWFCVVVQINGKVKDTDNADK